MLTLVLSHSLNSLQKFLTFGHDKNKWLFFLVVPYSKNILHYQFYKESKISIHFQLCHLFQLAICSAVYNQIPYYLFGLHKLFNKDITCHIYFVFKDKNAVIINLGYP